MVSPHTIIVFKQTYRSYLKPIAYTILYGVQNQSINIYMEMTQLPSSSKLAESTVHYLVTWFSFLNRIGFGTEAVRR